MAVQGGEHAAVADNRDRSALVLPRQRLERLADAHVELAAALGLGDAVIGIGFLHMARENPGEALMQFGDRESLRASEVALAKARIGNHFVLRHRPDARRGLERAAQVARHEHVERLVRQPPRERIGLQETGLGESAVTMALDARLEIPPGLAVPHDNEASHERTVLPSMYGTRALGTVSEPSAFWAFSMMATSVRPTARPEPLMVCTGSIFPFSPRNRACMRRAWKASKLEHDEISRYAVCPGSQTSRS